MVEDFEREMKEAQREYERTKEVCEEFINNSYQRYKKSIEVYNNELKKRLEDEVL